MLFRFEKHIHHHHHHYYHFPEIEEMTNALEDIRREVAEAKVAQSAAADAIMALLQDQAEKIAQIATLLANAQELDEFRAQATALMQELSDSTDSLTAAVAATKPAPTEPEAPAEPTAPVEDAPPADEAETPTPAEPATDDSGIEVVPPTDEAPQP